MAVKCPKCHSENPDTLKFCGECGTQIIRGHEPNSQEFGIVSPKSPTQTLELPIGELTTGSTFAGRYQIIEELGEKNRTLEHLGKAYLEREAAMAFLKVWPIFDSLRSEPRFQALLKKMNLA